MADSLDPGAASPTGADKPPLERRRSKNPIRSMMQHLTVESATSPDGEGTMSRRQSLMRRLSGHKSRSPSANSGAVTPPLSSSRPSSRPPSVIGLNRDPMLCSACASLAVEIDDSLEEVDATFLNAVNPPLAEDQFEKTEHFVARLKELEENRWATTCPLCKVFWSVHVSSERSGEYDLLGLSSRNTSYLVDAKMMNNQGHPAKGRARGISPGFLAVISKTALAGGENPVVDPNWFRESGMLLRTRPEVATDFPRGRVGQDGRLAIPEPVSPSPYTADDETWPLRGIWGREIGKVADMAVVKEWMHFCDSHHQGRCSRRPIRAELQGFKLIDCSESPPRVVQRSLQDEYVALSYVWGNPSVDPSWPQVVRDAAAVTRELGLRYLWVDRICINNRNREERMQHIDRMDEIFEGSALTIIAAAGENAMHGLPGIGSTPRPEQPKYKFASSNITLVSSLKDPRLLIQNSTWYTRGWTYQEGLISRRRLIFTEEQMYWECEGMACPETVDLPLEFYHNNEERRMCDFVRPGLFNGVSYMDGSWEQWKKLPQKLGDASTLSIFREVDQHIVNYTRRTLSFEEDSLDACLGVWRQLESTSGSGKLSNLVGMPIWAPSSESALGTRHLFALSTTFWHHKDGVQARRIPHLPSWSWAGWSGAVDLFSAVTIAVEAGGRLKGRKVHNHHYVTATQLTRNEHSCVKWTYSPEMVVLGPDGSQVYDFGIGQQQRNAAAGQGISSGSGPPRFSPGRYALHVMNPLVLDRVKARTHAGGWMFNDLSVDVRLSQGTGGTEASGLGGKQAMAGIRDYIQRHGRGEQMTVLWFVEEVLVMLLVVEKTNRGTWERVGRMRMAFSEEGKDILAACGTMDVLLAHLPLRRLGEDIIVE